MTSVPPRSADFIDNGRFRWGALLTALLASLAGAVGETLALAQNSETTAARIGTYLLISLVAAYELMGKRRTEPVLALAAVAFGVLSLLPATKMDGIDSGTTLAVLIVVAVIFVTTRQGTSATPLVVGSALIGVYTVALVVIESSTPANATGKLLIGIPGQILVIWITSRIIKSLAETSAFEARQRQMQEALALCSQALLTQEDEEPLSVALQAMLNATAADYAYIDINRVDSDGHVTWEIVGDAYGENIPPGPEDFGTGDYDQFPGVIEKMNAGEPATIRVSQLEMPLRLRYEAEGIRSELMAPIMIRGQWVGTIGFTDFWRDDEWSEHEVDALERAADMVAAFWQRETAREGLLELAKAKDRFIATVSHELRTPLSAVVGFADTLADGLDGFTHDEVIEMVDLIAGQSREVAELVDDLLTAERAASGNITVRPVEIDVRAECEAVVAGLQTDFFVNIEGDDVHAWADTLRTRQIIRNLLTNAARYGGEAVRIELEEIDGVARVSVFDSGSGVRSLDADLIFDPYYRTTKGESRTDSVGLGLAVARQLARLMGGDLVYQRRQGWTCFELSLPAAKRSAEALVT